MGRSGIITFLTDFGLTDAYTAMMKGIILSINRNAEIIDITHCIKAGSIFQAANILKEAFSYFPKGSVHAAVVDPGVGSSRRPVAVSAAGHFFVGPDNGLFWPIIAENENVEITNLTEGKYFRSHVTKTFHGRDIFAPVAAHISLGTELKQLGHRVTNPEKLMLPRPYLKDDILKGQINRIDNFGNLISNIQAIELNGFLGGKKPVVNIGDYKIPDICDTYSDRGEGELLALINSSGYLEIAVNLGKASEYLNKSPDEIIGTRVRISRVN